MVVVSMKELITNVRPDYLQLLQKLWKKVQDYENQYGKDDARKEFFVSFSQLIVWVLIQFDDFIKTQDYSTGKIKKYMTLDDASKPIMVTQLDIINRASFLTKLMFDFEHFLKNILDHFNRNIPTGYGGILNNYLDELGITDMHTKNVLKLPSSVRNALHNNGYTKHSINSTILRNKTYVANSGDQITFAGWDNIYIIIDEMTDCLITIIDGNTRMNSENNIPRKPHLI
ncbi:MAG: hypothetical protein WD717_07260 [Nitrosarchaeum sp.]